METGSVNTNQKTIDEIIKSNTSAIEKRNTGELGKDDFLKLLVTQLKYQDPLKPTEDTEFIAQMAQFSSLEQMQNMSRNFESVKAFSLIGKDISATLFDVSSGETTLVEGVVESVKLSKGEVCLVVNGKDIPMDKVEQVYPYYGEYPDLQETSEAL